MRKQMYRQVVLAWSALALGVVPAAAQAPRTPQPAQPAAPATDTRISITPFMALGDDLAPGGGLSVTFPLTRRLSLETEGSIGTDAMRMGASLLVDVVRIGPFSTYAAAGAGVQRDETDAYPVDVFFGDVLGGYPDLRYSPDFDRKKTEFALGIGGGATVPVGPGWSYRVDFRWYNPKAEWPESWRIYNGLSLRLGESH
jgi:hypothetical protein